jgi:hypothetical protein
MPGVWYQMLTCDVRPLSAVYVPVNYRVEGYPTSGVVPLGLTIGLFDALMNNRRPRNQERVRFRTGPA